jgi:epoxide hydrolase 4
LRPCFCNLVFAGLIQPARVSTETKAACPACRFWYSWRAQLEALQDDFEVAAMDLPGFNASQIPSQRCGFLTASLAKTVGDVIAALGRKSCVVVGHDWGGAIAFVFAHMYPQMVKRLVVLAAPPARLFKRNMDLHQMSASWYMVMFLAPVLAEMHLRAGDYKFCNAFGKTLPEGGFMARGGLPPEDVERYKDALARPGALTASLNYYRRAAASRVVI